MLVTTTQMNDALEVLHAAFVELREAAGAGDTQLAILLADTFEILPRLLRSDSADRVSLSKFGGEILHTLVERYPRLVRLERLWRATGIS